MQIGDRIRITSPFKVSKHLIGREGTIVDIYPKPRMGKKSEEIKDNALRRKRSKKPPADGVVNVYVVEIDPGGFQHQYHLFDNLVEKVISEERLAA